MISDTDLIRREVSLAETAERFGVPLVKDGDEWVAPCPFHEEDTPSFTIFHGRDRVQRMHCFGCGAKGDVLDFVRHIKRVDLPGAIRILKGEAAGPNIAPRHVEVRDVYAGIVPVDPVDEIEPGKRVTLYNPKRAGTEREVGSFVPSMVFPYRREDGSLFGYVLRHDLPDGKKETPMVMWVRLPNGLETWCRFPFPKPRPLYGLEDLGAGQVIVAEGEKCRDALVKATGRTVVSWAGGTEGAKHTDWSPLKGRGVIVWPDSDAPGRGTGDGIAGILTDQGCTVRVMGRKK
ncbi:CHC2 zinc finger domain-containing protein [Hyphomicrobium sp. ghe19]|uniref:CHC2 zinc finger domain-containing protein n=1 Tax=Hyphomicrobium sp. ghe19 TaxID=2682968 RepID=UPI0013672A00|nr:DNA primase [Hyphomicrobium sp. ghe19]